MKIVFFSHTTMRGSFVVGSHHLAKAMVRMGHDVMHVSAALSGAHLLGAVTSPLTRLRFLTWMRGGVDQNGVREIVPFSLLPWEVARLTQRCMLGYSRSMLASPVRGLGSLNIGSADCLMVDDPRFVGFVTGRTDCKLVYRATDLYSAMRGDRWIIEAERLICQRADLLIATSEPVAEHLHRLSGQTVHVITNGVDFDHFSKRISSNGSSAASLPGRREDRAVYVGAFDSRFGRAELKAAVRLLTDRFFLLIGPGADVVADEIGESNVVSLGAVDYSRLPDILLQCSVGLLPMSANGSNAGRSPMKLYEYAAAGLCIAATSTAELRRRNLPSLFLGLGETGFGDAVARAFECVGSENILREARNTARLEGWSGKAEKMLSLLRREDLVAHVDLEASS